MSDKPNKVKPNKKDSQLLIRISSAERERFLQVCENLDTTAAREIRLFIREFIAQFDSMHEQPPKKGIKRVQEDKDRQTKDQSSSRESAKARKQDQATKKVAEKSRLT